MSNTKNLANLAAALDDGTSGQVLQSTGSGGVQFADSTGSGVTVHANQAAMLTDAASADEGTLHYETGTNKLYVKQASGFYLLASITNATPTIDSFSENTGGAGANNLTAGGTFTLTSGSNTVVTINATDADLETISYSATVTSGTATDVFSSPSFPVTNQSSNVFTLTPVTSGSGGTVTIRFDASDGTNVANVSHSFEIAFSIADSHFTSLLMATDGSAGDNNDITDSSSNSHTITVNGDAHAGTFSPYRHGGYSVYFDGTTNTYLNVSSASGDMALGSGDFTISFWVYCNALNAYLLDYRPYNVNTTNYPHLRVNSSGYFIWTMGGVNLLTGNTAVSEKEWIYVCLARDNGVTKMYVNGTLQTATYSGTENLTHGTNRPVIGTGAYAITPMFDGYISDLRIVKSLDTTAYSVPTERMTAITNTQLLTCHLPYIADGSSNGHTITVNGNTSTKPFGPYDYNEYSESTNGGSVYFDGNDDLSATLSSAIGTGDFSISGWYYTGATPTTYHRRIFTIGGNNNANGMSFLHQTSGVLRLRIPANVTETHNYSYKAGQWVYFCIKRSSGTLTLHINGEQEYSGSDSTNLSSTSLCVGNDTIVLTSVYGIDGSVADFKISTSSIEDGSVPTSVVSSSGSILHLKGTDAHVLDKSQTGNVKLLDNTASTSVLTSNSTPPYIGAAWAGTSAVSFDGTGDRALITGVPDLGDDFTIEAWIYSTSTANDGIVGSIDNYQPFAGDGYWNFFRNASNKLILYIDGGTYTQSTSTVPLNQWVHVACTRSSGTVYYYIDGTRDSTTVSNSLFLKNPSGIVVGSSPNNTYIYNFNGYIQDLRLTVGKARYTAADESSNIPSAPLKG